MAAFLRPLQRAAFAAGCVAAAWTAGPARADYKLTILHTNDIHSRIEPIGKTDSTCGEKEAQAEACVGGVARLASAIARERLKAPQSLLLDAGDQFQGSLFYTFYKGRDAAEFMNRLGYEAMAVGNHEFDDGPAVLGRFAAAARFPLLMANADLSREPDLARRIAPTAVIAKAGRRIGLIGLTPEANGELTSAGKTIRFGDPVDAARRGVAALRAQGIDTIILLSHSGYGEDRRIAAAVDGIDVIVGGHSHTLLSNRIAGAAGPYPTLVEAPDGRGVPIVQAGSYGRYLGRLDVTFDEAGNVLAATGEPVLLDAGVPEDPAVKARVAALAEPLAALRDRPVAVVAAPVEGAREVCRFRECSMGNLVADAMLERTAGQGATIAIANGGGLRSSIDAGTVTVGEILTVLPFQNTLSTFRLKGADVVAALENGVSQVEAGSGRFPQVAGLEFDWTAGGEAGRTRIKAVRVKTAGGLAPIDPAATYTLVSNNFLRGGGDGYKIFADKALDAYDYGPTLETVVIDYLARHGGAYRPYTDGRIRQMP